MGYKYSIVYEIKNQNEAKPVISIFSSKEQKF